MRPIILIKITKENNKIVVDRSERQRIIQEAIERNKPIFSAVEDRLVEMGIDFKSCYTIGTIICLDNVSKAQLNIIQSWDEVEITTDGNAPIHLIRNI